MELQRAGEIGIMRLGAFLHDIGKFWRGACKKTDLKKTYDLWCRGFSKTEILGIGKKNGRNKDRAMP